METYDDLIKSAPTVFVEFFATWCPHCAAMQPVVDQLKELLAGSVPVYQLDIDKNSEAASDEGVDATPTFFIYRDGRQVWRHAGECDGNLLLQKIQHFAK